MGKRKRIAAEAIKAERSTQSFAKLRNVPSSPRKMRYVVDLVRDMEVFKALGILHFTKKEAALKVENCSARLSPIGNRRMDARQRITSCT